MKQTKKYMMRFGIGIVLYVVTLFISTTLVDGMGRTPAAYLLTLLPTIPAAYAMFNIFLGLREMDEMEYKVQFESAMITALVAMLFAFTWGLLEYASLVPNMPTFLFAPGMIWIWGMVSVVVRRRYI